MSSASSFAAPSVASGGGGGGGATAQQEAALRKLEAERDRLVAEVLTLQEAMSTSKACEECVKRRGRASARTRARARRPRKLGAPPAKTFISAPHRPSPATSRFLPRRLVKYVESTPEPFAEGAKDGPNPWTQKASGAPQCCSIA
jgi:hypothetical protein